MIRSGVVVAVVHPLDKFAEQLLGVLAHIASGVPAVPLLARRRVEAFVDDGVVAVALASDMSPSCRPPVVGDDWCQWVRRQGCARVADHSHQFLDRVVEQPGDSGLCGQRHGVILRLTARAGIPPLDGATGKRSDDCPVVAVTHEFNHFTVRMTVVGHDAVTRLRSHRSAGEVP